MCLVIVTLINIASLFCGEADVRFFSIPPFAGIED